MRGHGMKRVVFSITGMLALAAAMQPAAAADIPRQPPVYTKAPAYAPVLFDWSGFYVGVNGGWGWSRSSYDFAGTSSGTFHGDGGLVGGTIGYNYQAGQTVWGIEGDLDWANINGSAACPVGVATCETKNKWLSTIRGRLGYAADRFMPYLTGGVAFGNVQANVPGVGSASSTRTGWTVGAGVEYALSPNWSLKTEYLYVDLGKFDCGVACGGPTPTNVDYKAHIVRTGVNYRF
jgi:outer membrane immunogenic protein